MEIVFAIVLAHFPFSLNELESDEDEKNEENKIPPDENRKELFRQFTMGIECSENTSGEKKY